MINNIFLASVNRVVVNYNYFRVILTYANCFLYRKQTLLQQKLYIIINYDDGEIH